MGRRKLEFCQIWAIRPRVLLAKKKCNNGKTKTQIRAFISTTAGGAFYFSIIVVKCILTHIYIYIVWKLPESRKQKSLERTPTDVRAKRETGSIVNFDNREGLHLPNSHLYNVHRSTRNHLNSKRWSESCTICTPMCVRWLWDELRPRLVVVPSLVCWWLLSAVLEYFCVSPTCHSFNVPIILAAGPVRAFLCSVWRVYRGLTFRRMWLMWLLPRMMASWKRVSRIL